MDKYVARCSIEATDTLKASEDGECVGLFPDAGSLYLRPDKAREFARAVLDFADEIDGGEAAKSVDVPADETVPATPSVAPDRVALLEEAQRLVGSLDVGHLLDVAKFLAGESA